MKDLHIQSTTVYFNEQRISQLSFWVCIYAFYEQRNFHKTGVSPTFGHKFDLNLNCAFLHHKLSSSW